MRAIVDMIVVRCKAGVDACSDKEDAQKFVVRRDVEAEDVQYTG